MAKSRKHYWMCPNCRRKSERKFTYCQYGCETVKPKLREPKHKRILEEPYELFASVNGGDHCGICLTRPKLESGEKRLQRDHDHRTGKPRGLLCANCNRFLHNWWTPEKLRAAASYLERTKEAA